MARFLKFSKLLALCLFFRNPPQAIDCPSPYENTLSKN
ncbi:hypothetical protein DespoDRAFT_01075 [Desulfobacter postgatei 2ac9]|uniref:Uncharacterized protein n=1 Tax=Desulfobacter postgatei 2ac9 TaxID=879212 RepID=I5B0N3_9BACT|nr:hypothetical protein DespoDRAFT_01075 [Desulfobacter postgatei 2ac9]